MESNKEAVECSAPSEPIAILMPSHAEGLILNEVPASLEQDSQEMGRISLDR